MRHRARLQKLMDMVPAPQCPKCGGIEGRVVLIEAYDVEGELPWPPVCSRCGIAPFPVFLTLSPACIPSKPG